MIAFKHKNIEYTLNPALDFLPNWVLKNHPTTQLIFFHKMLEKLDGVLYLYYLEEGESTLFLIRESKFSPINETNTRFCRPLASRFFGFQLKLTLQQFLDIHRSPRCNWSRDGF